MTIALLGAVLSTPVGPLSVIVDEMPAHAPDVTAAFRAGGWDHRGTDRADGGCTVVRAAGYTADLDGHPARLPFADRARPFARRDDLGPVSGAIGRYHAGELGALDELVVRQAGTPHQQAVWQALRDIPPGSTRTYASLAASAGNHRAVRAAGAACGRNLVAPIVPCHRAVRSDGGLGGYYYGLAVKRWLLDHEAARTGTTASDPSSERTTRTEAP
jgi:methylated-DNA-[protein]-cysteine S-methyltransferase